MSEENELDVCSKDFDEKEVNRKSAPKEMSLEPIVRIKQETIVKDSDEEEFDSELEEEEEVESGSEDSEFDDEVESDEPQEEDENGKWKLFLNSQFKFYLICISLSPP